jgi:hypothetical protein
MKKKIDEDNFRKKYYKKKKKLKKLEKNHVRKNCINPLCFVRKNLYLLVIVILNQLNI